MVFAVDCDTGFCVALDHFAVECLFDIATLISLEFGWVQAWIAESNDDGIVGDFVCHDDFVFYFVDCVVGSDRPAASKTLGRFRLGRESTNSLVLIKLRTPIRINQLSPSFVRASAIWQLPPIY